MKILIAVLLGAILVVSGCTTDNKSTPKLDVFAKCLKDSGVKMYGSITCSHCQRQKQDFGSSFQYVGEIECHPSQPNSQTDLCLEKNIELTPTWILEDSNGNEIKRIVGRQSLETLAEFSGCTLGEY